LTWDGMVRLRTTTLGQLASRHGGEVRGNARGDAGADDAGAIGRFVPVERAGAGDLAPLLAARFVRLGTDAHARGARLLIDAKLCQRPDVARLPGWVHAHAAWAVAEVIDAWADVPNVPPSFGNGVTRGENVVLGARVVIGDRVRIGPGCVIGAPGFGWATGPDGRVRAVPQVGGVVIEDDVHLGSLCTIDAGTLAPTIIRRGAKIDSQVHVGHNCDIGEGAMIAAQSGFAGSVKIGRGVLVGGQVGVADHVTVGDGARIAGKSGVIGDVPSGAVVAGYPAVPRGRWLRVLARLYRR
jgi:UDP-3-O-[3-hydroxymyristoyl] glucosamine N-acyltransferase